MQLLCPICGQILTQSDRTCRCEAGHSFDIARQGYINLLTVQQKHSLNPGDTKEQVLSRRAFLEGGYYLPIVNALTETALSFPARGPVLDIGCGEGWYSTRLANALGAELTGLDISKEAVRCAAAKYKGQQWLCATAAHIPVADHAAGTLTSLFSLTLPKEFLRVLRPEGHFFQVLAAPDHLLGLKSVIYPQLKQKENAPAAEAEGFSLVKTLPIRFSFTVEGQQVQNLLSMTPHVYRISKEGAERLAQTPVLTDTASCILNVYRPR